MGNGLKALFICGLLAAGLPGGVAAAAAPQEVSYPSQDGTLIKAWVYLPDAPSPRGSVVALHGCGGLYASQGARKGQLNARHQAMADMLLGQGYVAVFPDSLTSRGESELCTQKIGARQIDQTQRRADTLGTLAWVAAQPWASASRIALLGWSHGGSAVLSGTDLSRSDVRAQLLQPALAVAFYPGCSAALKSGYRPSTRLVLMLGEKDDWTPPGPCVELGKAVGAEINLYADSYHGFDSPVGEVRLRLDVPNGVYPGRGVHVGPNAAAREQAHARLRELLAQTFR